MKRIFLTICIVAAGLYSGFAGRKIYEASRSTADLAIGAFAQYCLPFLNGTLVAPDHFWWEYKALGTLRWRHIQRDLLLSFGPDGCSVLIGADALSGAGFSAVSAQFSQLMQDELPDFFVMPGDPLPSWDEFQVYQTHPANHPHRMAVVLDRFERKGPSSYTTIAASIQDVEKMYLSLDPIRP